MGLTWGYVGGFGVVESLMAEDSDCGNETLNVTLDATLDVTLDAT